MQTDDKNNLNNPNGGDLPGDIAQQTPADVQPQDSMADVQPQDTGAEALQTDAPQAEAQAETANLNWISRLILKCCFGNKALAEIARFLIVGVIATVVDFVMAGITLYIFDPSLYPHFYNIFYGGGDPTTLASCVSTGVGFLFGLVVNYLLSIFFVFDDKGNSKTGLGFVIFALLSAGGLAIHVIGMWLLVDLAHMNYWVIKIMLTIVVLVYNYITRKLIIFKKKK